MNTASKKITSPFFILLGFIPVLLVLSFDVRQKAIRQEMKEKMGKQQLLKIVIPERAVVWEDEAEIWVNTLLFDIKTASLKDGVYTFTGLFDDEETGLFHQRNESNEKSSEETNLLEDLLDWIHAPYQARHHEIFFSSPDLNGFTVHNFLLTTKLFRKVPTPPPQHIVHT